MVIHGSAPTVPEGTVIQVCSVQIIASDSVLMAIAPEIQQLVEEFAALFEVPTELPPSRACDHTIPLVAGAVPVSFRPYRFAPALKDKIEKQVQEMLKNGLIQKSSSPFSSLVHLVKKKDGSWRFCMDYRHLNVITI